MENINIVKMRNAPPNLIYIVSLLFRVSTVAAFLICSHTSIEHPTLLKLQLQTQVALSMLFYFLLFLTPRNYGMNRSFDFARLNLLPMAQRTHFRLDLTIILAVLELPT